MSGAAQLGWRTDVPLLSAYSSRRRGRVRMEILMEDTDGKHPAATALGTQVETFNKSEKPSRSSHTERPNEDGSRPDVKGRTKGHNNGRN